MGFYAYPILLTVMTFGPLMPWDYKMVREAANRTNNMLDEKNDLFMLVRI